MSDLLNDSPVAAKFRSDILGSFQPGEQILFASDGSLRELFVDNWITYKGAIVITTEQIIFVYLKKFSRCYLYQVPWTKIVKSGKYESGAVGIQRTDDLRRATWELQIFDGAGHGGALDRSKLDLLSLSISEARQGLAQRQAQTAAAGEADASATYEELKKRRGF